MARQEIILFIDEIRSNFPDVIPLMDKHESWELTFRMEEFANLTTFAFNENKVTNAIKHLPYMNLKLDSASPTELKYIDAYYVEQLFWKATHIGIEIGWPLVPDKLKKLYLDFHGRKPKIQ
ncbi:hypothetical protein P20652_0151 [Pseudoalteromonas sp. BSi20652]|uniref:DUF7674 family protein n=1 Tax=Pseudoalteromonas sp. BSi20652 TaxID=388384 RepID=UPI0002319B72|nr:hypothetical protein [Pseudoalteromonas sp. BSi20652]GAA58300.1 hypothetical protein P20652_0151 [Pseudoalteromonas sp. BSi20652]